MSVAFYAQIALKTRIISPDLDPQAKHLQIMGRGALTSESDPIARNADGPVECVRRLPDHDESSASVSMTQEGDP